MSSEKENRLTKYRKMAGQLDQIGLMTNIHHIGKKHYEFLVNGEVKKSYKTRQSCNRQINKLYNNKFKSNE